MGVEEHGAGKSGWFTQGRFRGVIPIVARERLSMSALATVEPVDRDLQTNEFLNTGRLPWAPEK